MDVPGTALFRHRSIPSADRLLGLSYDSATTINSSDAVDLNEDDVLWSASSFAPPPPPPPPPPNHHQPSPPSTSAHRSFGILAALPEDDSKRPLRPHPIFHHKPSISPSSTSSSSSSSRMIPAIPRHPPDTHAPGSSKFHQSAPVKVPMMMSARLKQKAREFDDVGHDDEDGDGEMLPPHEMVARSAVRSPRLACSVLEGVGRTLKGRDLRQVRNAVWRKTGFLDQGI